MFSILEKYYNPLLYINIQRNLFNESQSIDFNRLLNKIEQLDFYYFHVTLLYMVLYVYNCQF